MPTRKGKNTRRADETREMPEPTRQGPRGVIRGHGHAPAAAATGETPAQRRRRLESLPEFREQQRRDRIRDGANTLPRDG